MFREDCLNCFKQSAIHLRKLPFNPFIKNCSFINPLRINDKEALSSVSNLTLIVCKTLSPVLKDIFKGCNAEEEVCDRARTEWRCLQMEELPSTSYQQQKNETPTIILGEGFPVC